MLLDLIELSVLLQKPLTRKENRAGHLAQECRRIGDGGLGVTYERMIRAAERRSIPMTSQ
jgi:hypothetical protein